MAWAEYYRQQAAFYGQTLGQAQAHSQVCSRCPDPIEESTGLGGLSKDVPGPPSNPGPRRRS